tara:strand:- start:211 stop:540 length:330 start_codon:yes stop_codon:yes gene_type:complete
MSLFKLNIIALETQIACKLSILIYEYYYPQGMTAKVDKKNIDNLKINYKLKALESEEIKPIFYFNFDQIKIKIFNSIAFVITLASVLDIGFGISNHLILNNKWYILSLI